MFSAAKNVGKNKFELDGVIYQVVEVENNSCHGCSAGQNLYMCDRFPLCYMRDPFFPFMKPIVARWIYVEVDKIYE